jgi:serine/threonine protein kinase
MGEVYRAHDLRLNRSVAIKILAGGTAVSAERRERFDREAQAVARLEHPHVCRLYDVGHEHDLDYLVMEYLEGETLASRMSRGALPADEAIDIATQIADALSHTHRHGLVHRDLKPGNVMLSGTSAKLLDFGIAKWLSGLDPAAKITTSTLIGVGAIAGTLPYMAPEQIDGKPVDERCDIFALGAILYEMLAGRPAFSGDTPSETMAAILTNQPEPLRNLTPDISPALAKVVTKCLAKRPADRWQSADELTGALQKFKGAPARDTRRAHVAASAPATKPADRLTATVPVRAATRGTRRMWAAALAATVSSRSARVLRSIATRNPRRRPSRRRTRRRGDRSPSWASGISQASRRGVALDGVRGNADDRADRRRADSRDCRQNVARMKIE